MDLLEGFDEDTQELIILVGLIEKHRAVIKKATEELEAIKTRIRERQDRLTQTGGVEPDEPYPEYVDPDMLSYLTIDPLCPCETEDAPLERSGA